MVAGLDENGLDVTWETEDWSARIIQHEMDHMDGKNTVLQSAEIEDICTFCIPTRFIDYIFFITGILFTDKMVPNSLEMNYWNIVNRRNGNFKLGFSGVGKLWMQYFFPKHEA